VANPIIKQLTGRISLTKAFALPTKTT